MSVNSIPLSLSDEWEIILETPLHWQMVARDLICAANNLRARFIVETSKSFETAAPDQVNQSDLYSSSRAMMLLYGLAIENLIKGLIIAKRIYPVIEHGKLNSTFSHDLKKQFHDALPAASADHDDLLELLKRYIQAGKYPAAKSPPQKRADKAYGFIYPSDIESIHNLLSILDKELHAAQPEETLELIDLTTLCT